MGRRRLTLTMAIGAALIVAGMVGAALWQVGAPRRALEAARARWEAAPVEHYRMAVEMRGWGGCAQDAEVRRERVVRIAKNSCRFFSPRTVTSLFTEVERFLRSPEFGATCRRGLPGRDCACYAPYQVSTVYNSRHGYPEELVVTIERYQPNRNHLHYWRYLLRNWREPNCGGPVEPAGRHVVVARFEPLP